MKIIIQGDIYWILFYISSHSWSSCLAKFLQKERHLTGRKKKYKLIFKINLFRHGHSWSGCEKDNSTTKTHIHESQTKQCNLHTYVGKKYPSKGVFLEIHCCFLFHYCEEQFNCFRVSLIQESLFQKR